MVNTDVKGSQEGVKGGSNSVAGKTGNDGKKGDDDIFEFLEELEKSNLSLTDKKGVERRLPQPQQQEKEEEEEKKKKKKKKKKRRRRPHCMTQLLLFQTGGPSSGSAKVSSIWNKTAEQASQIKNRLAQEQLDLTSKINTSTITEIARNLQKIVVGETEEVLRIHLVHDLVNYPSLQYNIESKFDQVLSSQVEGGIRIFVDEWGHPNNNGITPVEKKPSVADGELGNSKKKLQFNLFDGKVTDGEKLAFANLENAVKLFNTAHEEYQKQQKEADATPDDDRSSISSNSNKISDLFLSILPIAIPQKQKRCRR
ncbi:ANL_collapsed_G0028720.mRNA.1.CDS.1 [Saccharomyces cerevisiae]|nr:ANL_collapsed_G0028720.mRNA.1.CDS.1 [Saccharomyces cerevisiae]